MGTCGNYLGATLLLGGDDGVILGFKTLREQLNIAVIFVDVLRVTLQDQGDSQ